MMTLSNSLIIRKNTFSLSQWFWFAFFASLILKIYLAYLVPITGDEAEYIGWAQQLQGGYYDHPPMIAWILHPFILFSTSNICARFLQIITANFIAVLMYLGFRSLDREKAYGIALLYLISPISLFNITILTDTPLVLFSFLGIFCLFLAEKDNFRFYYYALSGVFLGCAYLSKYLMFPLALCVFIYFLTATNIPRRLLKGCLVILGALPFFIQNIVWNYSHDWVNFLFNLELRNKNSHFTALHLVTYIAFLFYMFSPFVIIAIVKRYRTCLTLLHKKPYRLLTLSALLPLLFYAVLAFVKKIGLHWVFCAYPFLFMLLFGVLHTSTIRRYARWMFYYTGFQLIIALAVFHVPLSFWQTKPYFPKINWFLNYEQIEPVLQPYLDQQFILLTPSYAQSYLLTYKQNKTAAVWGVGTVHGRQDDLSNDFKQFNQKNMVIVDLDRKLSSLSVAPYFVRYTVLERNLNGMPYRLIIGYGFNYAHYRATVLKAIYLTYYQVPAFLPRGEFYYKNKYQF